MIKTCRKCQRLFEITVQDIEFYDRLSPVYMQKKYTIPLPNLCFECRNQLRMSHRNERCLYSQTCALSNKPLISFFSPDKACVVYNRNDWWSDKWDAESYAQDIDFSSPLLEQFAQLRARVPRMNMMLTNSENCDYAPFSINSRNCHVSVSVINSENIYYGYQTNESYDCFDCSRCSKCELCYDCLYCVMLYHSVGCVFCENSSELFFCRDCRGCSNLIGCINLYNAQYQIFNQPVSKEEFRHAVRLLSSFNRYTEAQKKASVFFLSQAHRATHNISCENVSGDNLINCRNVSYGFDSKGLEDSKYIFVCASAAHNVMDNNYCLGTELCYNSMWIPNCYGCISLSNSWNCRFVSYSDECFHSSHCFLCAGLKNKSYCILNKQYTPDAYEKLLVQIVETMQQDGTWGEFFPAQMSPFGYNESIAQEYYPLSREQSLELGFKWSDYVSPLPNVSSIIDSLQLPDDICAVPDNICLSAIKCSVSQRLFKIIPQELKFLKENALPLPHKHPDVRYTERMKLRNPRKLFKRNCAKCAQPLNTTFAPQRTEQVCCDKCYMKMVY